MNLMEPEAPPRPTSKDPPPARRWTYGADVDTTAMRDRYGKDMCDLVIRCLMHQPNRRPDLRSLQNDIVRGVAAHPISAPERQWLSDTLFGPGQVPEAVPIPATAALGARVDLF